MVRLSDRPDITLDVYRGRKTTMQQQQQCETNEKRRSFVRTRDVANVRYDVNR